MGPTGAEWGWVEPTEVKSDIYSSSEEPGRPVASGDFHFSAMAGPVLGVGLPKLRDGFLKNPG